MKIRSIAIASFLAATAIALASCSGGMLGSGPAKTSAYIKVTVPGVAPWVLKAAKTASKSLGPTSRSASRAILEADTVNFTVTPQGSSTPAASWTEYPGYFASATPGNLTSTTSQNLPLGSYTLTVDVFNSAVSTTAPVVSGTATFALATNGETLPVTVVCAPTNAPSFTLGTPLPNQSLGLPWVFNFDGSLYSTGGEASSKINSISGNILVSMSTTSGSDVPLFGIVDWTGTILGVSAAGVPDVGITYATALGVDRSLLCRGFGRFGRQRRRR